MKMSDVIKKLKLVALSPYDEDIEIKGAYSSDLLSDVIANSNEGQLWITLQGHENVIAVAVLNDLAGVIVSGGFTPNPNTVSKAVEKGIALFTSDQNSYQLSGELYQLLQSKDGQ